MDPIEAAAGRFLPRREDLRAMLRLAGPVVTIQVGMMLMGVVDTVMVGHVSAVALAAVALGNLYFFGLGVFGMGTLMVLDPVVAQAVGARDDPAVARGIQRGFLIALMIGIPATLLLLPAELFMRLAQQPAEVIPLASAYASRLAPGVLPFFFFIVLRQSLQSMHLTVPIMIAIGVASPRASGQAMTNTVIVSVTAKSSVWPITQYHTTKVARPMTIAISTSHWDA